MTQRPPVFRLVLILTAFSGAALLWGCNSIAPSGTCGADLVDEFNSGGVASPLATPTHAFISGGVANFDWDHDVSGLCVAAPEASNFTVFTVLLNSGTNFQDMNFVGRVYAAAFVQPYTMRVLPATFPNLFQGTVSDIGLAQGNPVGNSATITTELHLTFGSPSGDIQADSARMRSVINNLGVSTSYKKAK